MKIVRLFVIAVIFVIPFCVLAQTGTGREHLLMDADWRFAFGHPYDTRKDFDNGTGYFSYLTKTGYGDGAAAAGFDDRSWRKLNLPHDWAVEQPFSAKAGFSHGFKAIGRKFPEASVGWYRKKFFIPATDLGRQISIAFDGVFRNSIVWVNGHYLGTDPSGYNSFAYTISDYLNYGGENTIAVRVDATMEEGWFYEGAGIYRHVWLNKTAPVHVATNGTFVTSKVNDNNAAVTAQVTLVNESTANKTVAIQQSIVDAAGKTVASSKTEEVLLLPYHDKDITAVMPVANPQLWSLETPTLYTLITRVMEGEKEVDRYQTRFGIRTIRFDANEGFFLNGRHVKIHGTNNHQDHAGVGTAMPDALQVFRIKALKAMGSNAYRCSHNPPTPELLNVCDSLGMLVIDENRLMGVTATHFDDIKRLILRDRNHPCIVSWSIGNEEWGIEGNITGARIATTLQAYAKSVDSTRAITAAVSGGWRKGISNVIDVMGFNYIGQINTDEQHSKFPNQPGWGTEEGSTRATRGVYEDDYQKHLIAAYDKKPTPNFNSIEDGWKHYATRNYLAGMFIWTGFDYRGEATPFDWPSVTSYFGMMDLCGFPKDNVYYLQSWWTDKTTLHLLPHWNWPGKEGKEIAVWAYSNCDEVELFLNKKSQGKQQMQVNGHLEWKVKYAPGMLEAIGYKNGKKVATDMVKTTGEPVAIQLQAAQPVALKADKRDIALVTVDVKDKSSLHVPTAGNEITFALQGPGKIIGVGNGDPTSLEPEQYLEVIKVVKIDNLKEKAVDNINNRNEAAAAYDDANWQPAFTDERDEKFGQRVKAVVYRGSFILPALTGKETITFFYNCIGKEQSVYINGKEIAAAIKEADKKGYVLDTSLAHAGTNTLAIVATPIIKKQSWENINTNPGVVQVITPAPAYKRKLFNGLAQVIVQSTGEPGDITLTATAPGIKPASLTIAAKEAALVPEVKPYE